MRTPGFAADMALAGGTPRGAVRHDTAELASQIVPAVPVPPECAELVEACRHGNGDACRAALNCMISAPAAAERALLRL
jgi:hypothetical protein